MVSVRVAGPDVLAEVSDSMALTGKERGLDSALLLLLLLRLLLLPAVAVEESGDTLRDVWETLPELGSLPPLP